MERTKKNGEGNDNWREGGREKDGRRKGMGMPCRESKGGRQS